MADRSDNENTDHSDDNRINSDDASSPRSWVVPTNQDVLMGHHKRLRVHSGNIRLDRLIEEQLPAHIRASSDFEKTCVVAATILRVQESGGRFLRLDKKKKQWYVLEDSCLHELISSRFRRKVRSYKERQGARSLPSYRPPSSS